MSIRPLNFSFFLYQKIYALILDEFIYCPLCYPLHDLRCFQNFQFFASIINEDYLMVQIVFVKVLLILYKI